MSFRQYAQPFLYNAQPNCDWQTDK